MIGIMKPERFSIEIPQAKLDDLARRLANVNWAPEIANADWRYGTSGAYLRELVRHWRERYDWRAAEKAMNAFAHWRVRIDGVPIHFMRVPGRGPAPLPLVLTHGWPWTFWDFRKVVGPLADPAAHGGDPADAFELIVPSLPGYAFSTPLERTGMNWHVTADLWVKLMRDVLGFPRFAAAGGDWGALVTLQLGHKYPDCVLGIHSTNAFPLPAFQGDRPWSLGDVATSVLETGRAEAARWERRFASHVAVHMLDPQTLAFALHDSPVGLAAWLIERRRAWSDCGGDVERRFSKDELLTTIMLYWLTDSFSSSIRYYAEAPDSGWTPAHEGLPVVRVPTGLSIFEHDSPPGARDWLRSYFNLALLREHRSGGHFAHAEEPEKLVTDLRDTFRGLLRG
jgi:pimeloyl-ACP methyl ester carboxylesterase